MRRTTHLLMAAALLLGACAAPDSTDDAASARPDAQPDAPTDAQPSTPTDAQPSPPPEPAPSPQPGAVPAEPVPGTSLAATTHAAAWFERLDLDLATGPSIAAIPRARRDPPRDATLGVLRVTDDIAPIPGVCAGEVRSLVAFDLGADGSPRIHEGLALLARQALHDATTVRDIATRPCRDEQRPFVYQEVAELACAIPDGRPYRCLVITTTGTGLARIVQYAPIDVRSGKIVSLQEITATVGARGQSGRNSVGAVLCALLPGSEEYARDLGDGPCPQLPDDIGLHPTTEGLRVLIPELAWPGTLDELLVPWSVLSWGDTPPLRAAPDPARVGGPEPRPTPTSIELRDAPEPWMRRLDVSSMIPMERIPDALADPALAPGLRPRTVTSRVDRERRYCAAERRVITGVDLGPGAAAARMGSDLVAAATAFHTLSDYLVAYGEGWCLDYGESRPWSFQELAEEVCALPGGPDVRCFTLTQWWYFEGTTGNPDHALDQPVYDTATGQRVPVATVIAGADGDADTAVQRAATVLCESKVLDGIGFGGCGTIPILRAHPTVNGVWIGFNARDDLGHLATRYLEVFLPWSELWPEGRG